MNENSQLGTHIDGYPAIVAHTFVIGATKVNSNISKFYSNIYKLL